MLGADIATAEFSNRTACTFTDRYVPFVAYPLFESVPGSSSVFPLPDDCQDDASWVLLRCERDSSTGQMLLEVSRTLDAHDTQDRAVVEGVNSFIFAYGDGFKYHRGRRGAADVVFYENGAVVEDGGDVKLPEDVDGFFDIRATNFTIPNDKPTIYACTSNVFELDGREERMIIAADYFTNTELVHHLVLFICSGEEYAAKVKDTVECSSDPTNGINGVRSPEAQCTTFVLACELYSFLSVNVLPGCLLRVFLTSVVYVFVL